jgi:hypothetical protein
MRWTDQFKAKISGPASRLMLLAKEMSIVSKKQKFTGRNISFRNKLDKRKESHLHTIMLRTDNEKRQNKIRRRRHRPTIM